MNFLYVLSAGLGHLGMIGISFTTPDSLNNDLSCFSVCVNIIQIHVLTDESRMLVWKGQIPSVLVAWWTASSDEVKVLSEVFEVSTRHQRELIPLFDTALFENHTEMFEAN